MNDPWWFISFSTGEPVGGALGGAYVQAQTAVAAQAIAEATLKPEGTTQVRIVGPIPDGDTEFDKEVSADLRGIFIPVGHPHLTTVGPDNEVWDAAGEWFGESHLHDTMEEA